MIHCFFIFLLVPLFSAEQPRIYNKTLESFYDALYGKRYVEIDQKSFLTEAIRIRGDIRQHSSLFSSCTDDLGIREHYKSETAAYRQAIVDYFGAYMFYLIQPQKYPFRPLPKGQALIQEAWQRSNLDAVIKRLHDNVAFSHFTIHKLEAEYEYAHNFVMHLAHAILKAKK
jgi:hypothetical protein